MAGQLPLEANELKQTVRHIPKSAVRRSRKGCQVYRVVTRYTAGSILLFSSPFRFDAIPELVNYWVRLQVSVPALAQNVESIGNPPL